MQLGRRRSQGFVLSEGEQRWCEGVALLATLTLRYVPAPSGLIPPAVAGGLAVEHPYEREQFRCNLAKLAQEGNAGHGIIRTTAVQGHQHGIGPQG